MNNGVHALLPTIPGIRKLTMLVTLALIASLVALVSSNTTWAQEDASCQINHLGTLGDEANSKLRTAGRWTTNDCDSRFQADSDAHTYRFNVTQAGRIRIDLKSNDRDSYLYLLAVDGSRITDSDDGGAGLNARIERDLMPGSYMVEATTVGGRERGAASFTLSIGRAPDCDPVHLGALQPGMDLTATGLWSLDTCGSQFVVQHPAHSYTFDMPQNGRVRLDLRSENGDPVMSLVSLSRGLIAANDDGGGERNSRIEQYLQAGRYLVEATTYLEGDLQPLRANFTLVVHLVDEEARAKSQNLKIEEVYVPEQVIAGEPFEVHYRVGNLGGGDLGNIGGRAIAYVVGPRVFDRSPTIFGSEDRWQAGVSYHTDPRTATPFSVEIDEVQGFEVTFNRTGPSWVFVAIIANDRSGEEIAFNGIWKNLLVLSGRTFDQVTVEVDGLDYEVSARASTSGVVTNRVTSVDDPGTGVTTGVRAKAIYAAGVHTQALDDIFERPGLADLPTTAEPEAISVANPSSASLLKTIGNQYARDVTASGLVDGMAAGEAINPIVIEDMTLGAAQTAAAQYASLAGAWSALQERIAGGGSLSFEEAFAVHSQLAYAESVLASAVEAGEIVEAARAADMGWEAPEVQEMIGSLSRQASCDIELSDALEEAYIEDSDALLDLDAEMRAALPVYSLANDSARCAASAVDAVTSRLLESLSLDHNEELNRLLIPRPSTVAAPTGHHLRIIAQLDEDGRLEHGVELSNGEQILPSSRFTPTDSPVDAWLASSDVEVDEKSIGNILSRRLEDGRIELRFLTTTSEEIEPDIRYLAAGSPAGVWLRSTEIEAPPEPTSKDRPAEYTQALVLQAIERYERNGLEETVAYYNTSESMDGQWYVFIFDENDVMLTHADQSLVGLPASEVLGPNGYPTGEVVVTVADEAGAWSDYTFPNPAAGTVETKHSWVVRHENLVFGSGWYEPGPSRQDAPAYTQAFVQQAINLYDALGYRDTVEYYNTAESVDGQWYVFIGDQNDVMRAHAGNPDLVGLHASEILGPNGYPSGELVAAVATEDGVWSSYTFPNPASGAVETKHSWVVRYDLLVFGSGWYEAGPSKSDEPAYTQAFVQQAINLYDALGRERAIEYYSTTESVDDQWYVFIIDENGYTIAHHNPMFLGRDPALRVDSTGHFYGDDLLSADEDGRWVDYLLLNPATGDERQKHTWAVRYDGLIFASGWYEE